MVTIVIDSTLSNTKALAELPAASQAFGLNGRHVAKVAVQHTATARNASDRKRSIEERRHLWG